MNKNSKVTSDSAEKILKFRDRTITEALTQKQHKTTDTISPATASSDLTLDLNQSPDLKKALSSLRKLLSALPDDLDSSHYFNDDESFESCCGLIECLLDDIFTAIDTQYPEAFKDLAADTEASILILPVEEKSDLTEPLLNNHRLLLGASQGNHTRTIIPMFKSTHKTPGEDTQ